MNTISSRISPSLLSSHELSTATSYLNSTRDSLLETLSGLSDSQWHFKPAPDHWSIAEILEHIVLIEDRVHAIVGGMQDAPPTEPDRIDSQVEEIILTQVPRRSTKLQAAPQVSPSHRPCGNSCTLPRKPNSYSRITRRSAFSSRTCGSASRSRPLGWLPMDSSCCCSQRQTY